MKNYVIIFLAVCLIVSVSLIFKNERKRVFNDFPEPTVERAQEIEGPLNLYLFFSKNNCSDCLEIIEVLNTLPKQFNVCGIVPDDELSQEKQLREKSGALFPLIGARSYTKFSPNYWPTLIGTSKSSKILFLLPGVPNEKKYLEEFLNSFFDRVYPLLVEEE
jgi:hypothetical protein